jgi:diguanylate cyclase (GGDEF)-like protein
MADQRQARQLTICKVAPAAVMLGVGAMLAWQQASDPGQASAMTAQVAATIAASAGFIVGLAAWQRPHPIRAAWLAAAAGCAAWSASMLALQSPLDRASTIHFLLVHGGWVGLTAGLTAAILLLARPPRDRDARRTLLLDLVPTLLSLAIAVWLAVVGPAGLSLDAPWRVLVAAALHGGGTLILLAAALAGLLLPSHFTSAAPTRYLSASLAALAVADLLWLQPWLADRADASVAARTAFLTGFLALAAGALVSLATPLRETDESKQLPLVFGSGWLQHAPYVSLLLLLVLALGQVVIGDLQAHGTETALGGCVAVVMFAMLRQGIALRHAQKLHNQIGQLTHQVDGLIQQVGRDPLTGLFNRRAIEMRMEQELAQGRALKQPLAVVLIDVDNFKNVNDTLGHQAGDRVLVAVGSILSAACRTTDVAARYAGDEFILVLPGLDEAHAGAVCERIVQEVHRLADELRFGSLRVTLSVGAAVTHRCRRTAAQLVEIADAAMYDAKMEGKDRIVVVNADTLQSASLTKREPEEFLPATYLPAPFVRPLADRRQRRELAERAS